MKGLKGLKGIFINKNSEIRSGWKILLTLIVFFITTIVASKMFSNVLIIISTLISGINNVIDTVGIMLIVLNVLQCLCVIGSVVLFWKLFEKKPISEMGLINIKKGYKDLVIGLIFGAVSMSIVFGILLGSKNIEMVNPLTRPSFNIYILIELILFIFVGFNEEMFARGYCMSVLNQTRKKWVIVGVSSIIFALMHSFNPNMSALSYFNLFLVGILFAYMFIKSNNLWLSIGYHITWNFFQGSVFGFQVSGLSMESMYLVKEPADNVITGGGFGPEGGLVVTFIIVLGFIYMWKLYKPREARGTGLLT
ncbi:MAG: CPBP family intramembrane metalloprotease [Clostridiaceae bacterium]|nr:CPBP family intramembrane metalloprotease [Clostridiaceae bacterium]